MRRRSFIIILMGLVAAALAAVSVTGCGDGENKFVGTATPATQVQCDSNAPSLIPAPKGKPLYVEFYRDT